jgi:predicted TIM-barrel fold metal-dependent hydrolase
VATKPYIIALEEHYKDTEERFTFGAPAAGCAPAPPAAVSADTFCEHFYITTSGFFSDPTLLCSVMEMGIDRILFSVDYPFVDNPPGTKWTETLPLCAEDKEKLLNGNARRLLKV